MPSINVIAFIVRLIIGMSGILALGDLSRAPQKLIFGLIFRDLRATVVSVIVIPLLAQTVVSRIRLGLMLPMVTREASRLLIEAGL